MVEEAEGERMLLITPFIEYLLYAVTMIGILYTIIYQPHHSSAKKGVTPFLLIRKWRLTLGYHGRQGMDLDPPLSWVSSSELWSFSLLCAHLCPALGPRTVVVGGLAFWL